MENNKLTIVVVEDSLFYQQLISKIVKPLATEVMLFTSGEQVLSQLPLRKVDLAILDYDLDSTMTGLDVLTALRRNHPAVHVIMFSTCQEVNTSRNRHAFGNFHFVEKNREGLLHLHDTVTQVTGSMP